MPPALESAVLPVMVQPVTVRCPELAMQAPEAPPLAVFEVKVQLVTLAVTELLFWIPPPGPPLVRKLGLKMNLLMVMAPWLKRAPPPLEPAVLPVKATLFS